MTGQLITLPMRLWWRGAMLVVHTAEDVTELALTTTLRVAGALENLRPGGGARASETWSAPPAPAPPFSPPTRTQQPTPTPEPIPTPEPPSTPEPTPTPEPARAQEPTSNGGPQPLASERLEDEGLVTTVDLDASEPEPLHVSEEPELVRESAEPGAEEGAGASVHVRAPWEGYERLSAREVIARCRAASPAELAAVRLYEVAHRNRRTVLEAVERGMKSAQPGR